MIISDLQFIESASDVDVQGGRGRSPIVIRKTRTARVQGGLDVLGSGDRTTARGRLVMTADSDNGQSSVVANGGATASSSSIQAIIF